MNSDFNEFLSILPNLRKIIKLAATDPNAPEQVHDLVAWYTEAGIMWHKDGPPGVGFVFPSAVRFLFEFERLDKKMILIRSPKTGSATLNHLFEARFPHLAPALMRQLLTEEEWYQATKICFVRNTFDRLVSWFLHTSQSWSDYGRDAQQFYEKYGVQYITGGPPRLTHVDKAMVESGQPIALTELAPMERKFLKEGFRNWIKDGAPPLPRTSDSVERPDGGISERANLHTVKEINNLPINVFNQLLWAHNIAENAKPDFVGRFDNFAEDVRRASDLLGIEPTEELPHRNKASNRLPYQEYYDDESVQKVNEMFQEEIDYFGFKF
ncbi:hypothetical protein CMI37_00845 [Candidatus Pacearchaeota archaeon]|nr:hypothetical protein [Candidatus Pacearchaeota archaeon]|tara:strand:- start:4578 stop:5552 length:975 start_codon:yes stop_codon:yes gene_type:complete